MSRYSADIAEFRDRLRIDKHNLDGELEIQSECQERIGRQVEALTTSVARLKRMMEATEADVLEEVKRDDPKLSNPLAEKEVRRNSKFIRAWEEYHTLKQELGEWTRLYEAWVARGYSLKDLASLHGQQYYTVDSTTGTRERLREAVSRSVDRRSSEGRQRRVIGEHSR